MEEEFSCPRGSSKLFECKKNDFLIKFKLNVSVSRGEKLCKL
jgi:hypothetical protein